MNVYIVKLVRKSNHSFNVAAFTEESLAKIYCRIKNKDAWIDKGKYEYEAVEIQDANPELGEFVLQGESDGKYEG